MLLELYQRLAGIGFPIVNYHYVGFGSIFFMDFKLVHKAMGISKMTSIEGFPSLWPRCTFNLPFENVTLFKGMSSSFVPIIDRDELYLGWLDYDFSMNRIVADDLSGMIATMRPWSLVVVTIDLEEPQDRRSASPAELHAHYQAELPDFAFAGMKVGDFRPPARETTILSMLERSLAQGLSGRVGLTFEYLVRLAYADGHRMLTVGGMIADSAARAKLSGDGLADLWYLSRGPSGGIVEIPKLVFTQKEVAELEQCLPTQEKPPVRVGVSQEDFDNLRLFYRYWPSYGELLA
jgi:hypothetical protein